MGQHANTPLSLVTDHFSVFQFRGNALFVVVKNGKLTTYCGAEWPALGIGWPAEGSSNLTLVTKVKEKLLSDEGRESTD